MRAGVGLTCRLFEPMQVSAGAVVKSANGMVVVVQVDLERRVRQGRTTGVIEVTGVRSGTECTKPTNGPTFTPPSRHLHVHTAFPPRLL